MTSRNPMKALPVMLAMIAFWAGSFLASALAQSVTVAPVPTPTPQLVYIDSSSATTPASTITVKPAAVIVVLRQINWVGSDVTTRAQRTWPHGNGELTPPAIFESAAQPNTLSGYTEVGRFTAGSLPGTAYIEIKYTTTTHPPTVTTTSIQVVVAP